MGKINEGDSYKLVTANLPLVSIEPPQVEDGNQVFEYRCQRVKCDKSDFNAMLVNRTIPPMTLSNERYKVGDSKTVSAE